MEYLFIGGQRDGERHFTDGAQYVQLPYFSSRLGVFYHDSEDKVFSYVQYKKMRLCAENNFFDVYVLSNMSASDALLKMIESYNRAVEVVES